MSTQPLTTAELDRIKRGARPVVPGRFSIGIPTYNRCEFLRRSIRCALGQSHQDVEIIVSDNASTDDTSLLAAEFGAKIVYHRNDRNVGGGGNWGQLPFLATGEYFSWLQDDDLIYRDFSSKAADSFRARSDVNAYACYSAAGPSDSFFIYPVIYGPAVPLDWAGGSSQCFEPSSLAAIAFFFQIGVPPTLAFRTASLRQAILSIPTDCDLYVERLVPLFAAGNGKLCFEPWVGGMFFHHDSQYHKELNRQNAAVEHWTNMARRLGTYIEELGDDSWRPFLKKCFSQMAVRDRIKWLHDQHTATIDWKAVHPIAHEARELLLASLPPEDRPRPVSKGSMLRSLVKDLMPPIVLKGANRIRRGLSGR